MRVEGEIDVYIFMRMFTFLYERMDDDDWSCWGGACAFCFFDFDLLYIT